MFCSLAPKVWEGLTYLTIEKAVEDGHHKTLGRKGGGEVR